MRMQDKVTLITGAVGGIGLAIAQGFAREGAKVAITDLDLEAAEQAAEIIRQDGGDALAIAMDVTDEAAVDAGVAAVVEQWGRLDVAVANAGIQHIEALDKLSLDNWRKVTAVHLDGAFLTTRASLRQMYRQPGRACILYLGSVHSKLASPLKAPYVAAKHGILGLCRAVAKEGAAHGVSANVICPGFVRTPLVERQIPEQAHALGITEEQVINEMMLKETVDREFTTLEDISELAINLAAFPSAALTGQSIVVSHGWHMQ